MGNFEDHYMTYPEYPEYPDDDEGSEPEYVGSSPEELQQAYDDMQREFEALTLKLARANGTHQQPHPDTQNQGILMGQESQLSNQERGISEAQGQGDEIGSRSRQAKSCQEKFLPYNTMYKLDVRSQNGMENSPTPRVVVCVNCRASISLAYLLECEKESGCTHNFCPKCEVCSAEYWEGKPHRRVEDAKTGP